MSAKRKKELAESNYGYFLDVITEEVGETTIIGRLKFRGVHARDEIPDLKTGQGCIVNNQRSDQGGEHWLALAKCRDGSLLQYDSYGREDFLKLRGEAQTRDTERDAEQTAKEENCGNRCVAFLAVFFTLGEEFAVYI